MYARLTTTLALALGLTACEARSGSATCDGSQGTTRCSAPDGDAAQDAGRPLSDSGDASDDAAIRDAASPDHRDAKATSDGAIGDGGEGGCDGGACDDSAACGEGGCGKCSGNQECSDPGHPVCNKEAGECAGPCTSDLDCERDLSSWTTPHCELGQGVCVGCIPGALEVEQCVNGNACDPVAMTCSGKPRTSVQNCEPCSADSECASNLYCVPSTASEATNQNYCVLRKDTGYCPAQFGTARTATSVQGVTARFCFPNEAITTCEAVLHFSEPCESDTQCGPTGICEGTGTDKRCTYVCDGVPDCSTSCIGAEPRYCDPN